MLPFWPTHQTSIDVLIRETAARPPLVEALPAPARVNWFQPCPAYQYASLTEPFGATHHSSIELFTRETAAMSLVVAALPAPANVNRFQPWPAYQYASWIEP